jgi:hypothetical protein
MRETNIKYLINNKIKDLKNVRKKTNCSRVVVRGSKRPAIIKKLSNRNNR